ncbi:hypothetical protein CFP56_039692 [Quercus suber]|uniref:Uncharacterized protein n=1 Tax=Quercus suber TaxID=58331 RepID=A0AAW0MA82_QUESU
MRRCVTMLIC